MIFRYARHTNHLQPLVEFYCGILGLELLGEFKSHQGYDGVFIGYANTFRKPNSWHLEFTVSWEQPLHRPDEDDLMVFYPNSDEDYQKIIERLKRANIKRSHPKNPYWLRNGITVIDPEGYRVVIAALEK